MVPSVAQALSSHGVRVSKLQGPAPALQPLRACGSHKVAGFRGRSGQRVVAGAVAQPAQASSNFVSEDVPSVAQGPSQADLAAQAGPPEPSVPSPSGDQLQAALLNVGVLTFAGAAVVAHVLTKDASLWDLYQQSVTANPIATKVGGAAGGGCMGHRPPARAHAAPPAGLLEAKPSLAGSLSGRAASVSPQAQPSACSLRAGCHLWRGVCAGRHHGAGAEGWRAGREQGAGCCGRAAAACAGVRVRGGGEGKQSAWDRV